MRIDYLKEVLSMYPDDMEVWVRTTPNDMCQPLTLKAFSQTEAYVEEKFGLQPARIILTAFHPTGIKS